MDSSNLHYHSSSSPHSSESRYESLSLNGTTSEFINQNFNDSIQDWTGSGNNDERSSSGFKYISRSHDSDNDLNLAKIKENQLASSSSSEYSFTEMLNPASSSSFKDLSDISEKLLLQTISPDFSMFSAGGGCRAGNFSQIYPSINISNLSNNIQPSSSMNLQALDLLSPPVRFSRSHSFPSLPCFELPRMHQSTTRNLKNMPSLFRNEITDHAKRSSPPSSLPEPKATQASAKKSRVEPRSSCPPFKVRKEKLGDRVAALQQLVAPYGKTDTASVLMEAIGYIKFLQNQVETLSVPYMKSSCNKRSDDEYPRRELRSRGLCLVPLSCMSYVTGDNGGGIWPPPNFG